MQSEFLVFGDTREFLIAGIVDKINVIRQRELGWQHDEMQIPADIGQFTVTFLEQEIGRNSVDDDIERQLLAGDPDRAPWNVVALDFGAKMNLRFGSGDCEVIVVSVMRDR